MRRGRELAALALALGLALWHLCVTHVVLRGPGWAAGRGESARVHPGLAAEKEEPLPESVHPFSMAWDNSIAACAIARSEATADVREWLAYHRKALGGKGGGQGSGQGAMQALLRPSPFSDRPPSPDPCPGMWASIMCSCSTIARTAARRRQSSPTLCVTASSRVWCWTAQGSRCYGLGRG